MSQNYDEGALQAMQQAVQSRAASREHVPPHKAKEIATPLQESQILACVNENFLGDAKIFTHLMRGKFLYVQQWEKWLFWTGHCWKVDINDTLALAAVDEVAQEYLRIAAIVQGQIEDPNSDKATKEVLEDRKEKLTKRAFRCRGRDRKTVLEFAHSGAEPLAILGSELDKDPYLLGVANGVIDLKTCEFRPGKPEDYITVACDTEWQGPDADGGPFLNFLQQMLGTDELVKFMLRFLGMALLARQREHKFLVLFGEGGRNGKDTLMSILMDVLGREMCGSVAPELFMEQSFIADPAKPSPHLLALRGKRIVYASESSRKHRFNSETVKRLTGGGQLEARGLQETHMTKWEMTHTVVLLTNELPAAPPGDGPFWERLLGIELQRRFVDNPDPNKPGIEFPKDPDLRTKIAACGPGTLALLVKGYADYIKEGLLPPPTVTAFGEKYRESEDIVGLFLADACKTYTGEKDKQANREQASILYECFAWWYALNISKKGNYGGQRFGKEMRRKGFDVVKNSTNYYVGVTISPETMEEWEKSKGTRKNWGKDE